MMGRYEIEAEKEIESLQKWMLEARDDRDRCMEEIETLKAGREEAVKLVLDAGLSTGHADTCGDLMLEVMGEIESLRGQLDDMKRYAIEMSDDGDEWNRRAKCLWDLMYNRSEFLQIHAEAAEWFEEDKDDAV